MKNNLIYTIPKEMHSKQNIKNILLAHPEIKFVSLCGIDLLFNDIDEKIPVNLFLNDLDKFLDGIAVKTDGSSVNLPGIATLNNAQVDIKVDLNCSWYIDYNYEHIDEITNLPVGTLTIPSFLFHEGVAVDSRSVLKSTLKHFKNSLISLFETSNVLDCFGIKFYDIADVNITLATELEFWVKTPNELADVEELCTSEVLKEQYWKRTKGSVRTSLEKSLLLLEKYGLNPEMGHKEVGGVKAQLTTTGSLTHIMEQLEIDWTYSDAISCCDNDLLVRNLVKETFRKNGLDVTFMAKPIDNIAGSGKHLHIGVLLHLKNGEKINLFHSNKDFMSVLGYGALMGILKNYDIINPFVSNSIDSIKRLQPGFEAPVCTCTSLGLNKDMPSRNRTVLLALIREEDNPYSTRFELRSPCPHTNSYLATSASILSMLDGLTYVIKNNKTTEDLLMEISKEYGEEASYLENNRKYRSENNIFTDYSKEELEKYFGKAPKTVLENLKSFDNKSKVSKINCGTILNDKIINSYRMGVTERYLNELTGRLIPQYVKVVRNCQKLNHDENSKIDVANWENIQSLRNYIMKDNDENFSLFTKIKTAINEYDLNEVSNLQIELDEKISLLKNLYNKYKQNLIEL
ncbi:type I glutamate--ammonia ligase [Clostridium senegalense]|uniref:glutamine synthetase n=1 Tax=Clostridium senegalense TaxID=1465809 RepID=UPI00028A0ED3|nr:glutamine synthetase [Clostridium senegalense]MBU5227675.1 glutamine synthetase [Clostridium senegalense]